MIPKPSAQITESDLLQLIQNKVTESKTLEYKLILPGNSDSEKREFLADICAFANANGGDILFGIEGERDSEGKSTGAAGTIQGVTVDSIDLLRQKLISQIQDGIAPRIAGIEIVPIGLYHNGPVILIRIPKSFAHPHWVTYRKDPPFYSRNTSGKYPMDIGEIRAAFSINGMIADRVREFRQNRISLIAAGETPAPLDRGTPKAILHLIPAQFWTGEINIYSREYAEAFRVVGPMAHSGWNHRYNFDGVVTFRDTGRNEEDGYSQYFGNGIVEIVSDRIVTQHQSAPGLRQTIPSSLFEQSIINSLTDGLKFFSKCQITPPYYICLTLIGIKGRIMYSDRRGNVDTEPIDRDVLMIPEFIYDEHAPAIEAFLYPIFNFVWRSSGIPASPNYTADGKRVLSR